jgi:hypothetical protein
MDSKWAAAARTRLYGSGGTKVTQPHPNVAATPAWQGRSPSFLEGSRQAPILLQLVCAGLRMAFDESWTRIPIDLSGLDRKCAGVLETLPRSYSCPRTQTGEVTLEWYSAQCLSGATEELHPACGATGEMPNVKLG